LINQLTYSINISSPVITTRSYFGFLFSKLSEKRDEASSSFSFFFKFELEKEAERNLFAGDA